MKKVLMSLLMLVFCIFICNASYAAFHWSELTYYKRQTWQEYYGTACSTHGASCTPYLVTHKNADGQVDKHWMHIVGTTNKKGSSGEPTAVDGNLHPWLSNLWDPGVFCCIHDNTFAYNSEQNKLRQHTFIEGTSVTMRSYNPELKSGYANKVSRAAQWAFILSESSSNGTYDAPRIKENYDNIQAYCLWTVVGAFEQGVEDCGLEQFKMPTKTHGRAWLEERINLGDTYAMQHKQEILDLYDESKAYNDFLENRMEPRSIDREHIKKQLLMIEKYVDHLKSNIQMGFIKMKNLVEYI